MAQIKIHAGDFNKSSCTLSRNLTANQEKFPAIRDVMQYAEPRMVSTMIATGIGTPYEAEEHTRVPDITKRTKTHKSIGDNTYKYRVMGRIQKAAAINNQVGTSSDNGTFQLSMKTNYLWRGLFVRFHSGLKARVQNEPTGSEGNYIYTFQTEDGTAFDWTRDVAPQEGTKTCFPAHTGYSEKSRSSDSRGHFADWYRNHMTIQRKSCGISGSAGSDVLWYEWGKGKGWMFKEEREKRVQFMMEDEDHKWFSRSTKKDSNGNPLDTAVIIDPETGNEVITGDGIVEQISGVNDAEGSGSNGNATYDDFKDMMRRLEKRSNGVYGRSWTIVTGTDGYQNFQDIFGDKMENYTRVRETHSNKVGGKHITGGYTISGWNYAGNQITIYKHPMFDDQERFTKIGRDGRPVQSGTYYFLDTSLNQEGVPNVELLGKGGYGFNRTMVSGYLNGLSGLNKGIMTSAVDGIEYHMLKEDMICIYNPRSCGILSKPAR